MPDQQDDHVPPMKVMRKRLNGVYAADTGFSGPTRRYVLIVAMLVGLASVPTLAAITVGSNEIADGTTDTMDIPFLPPASPGPIQPTTPDDGSVAAQGGEQGADAALRAGRLLGSAGERQPRSKPDSRYGVKPSKAAPRARSRADAAGFRPLPGMPRVPRAPRVSVESTTAPDAPSRPARPPAQPARRAEPTEPAKPARPAKPTKPAAPAEPAKPAAPVEPAKPAAPAEPAMPAAPAEPAKPAAPAEPAKPAEPHEPVLPRMPELPTTPDDSDGQFPDHGDDGEEPTSSDNSDNSPNPPKEPPARTGPAPCPDRGKRHPNRFHARPDDRARHSRRSAVAERPPNIRPDSILERSYGSNSNHGRRLVPDSRAEENQIANRSYQGSHRAGSAHHAEEHTPAQQRSSRVGRHHAEPTEDVSNRW